MITKNQIDKQIAESLPPIENVVEQQIVVDALAKFLKDNSITQGSHLMLLSNELNYYTIFTISNNAVRVGAPANNILKFITDDGYLQTIGELKYAELNENGYFEIWKGSTHFALFPCDGFFVGI